MKYVSGINHELDVTDYLLREMRSEIDQLSEKLATLSQEWHQSLPILDGKEAWTQSDHDITENNVKAVIQARRARCQFFPAELFADPAWDILLHLLHADSGQRRVTVSEVCKAAAVPPTTALRWLKSLEKLDLVVRRSDPFDARRAFLGLTAVGKSAMQDYFKANMVEQPIG